MWANSQKTADLFKLTNRTLNRKLFWWQWVWENKEQKNFAVRSILRNVIFIAQNENNNVWANPNSSYGTIRNKFFM